MAFNLLRERAKFQLAFQYKPNKFQVSVAATCERGVNEVVVGWA